MGLKICMRRGPPLNSTYEIRTGEFYMTLRLVLDTWKMKADQISYANVRFVADVAPA